MSEDQPVFKVVTPQKATDDLQKQIEDLIDANTNLSAGRIIGVLEIVKFNYMMSMRGL